jgi:hypothetical protein
MFFYISQWQERNGTKVNLQHKCNTVKKKSLLINRLTGLRAVWTGLEPATPCVTGRYSNQLNYHTKFLLQKVYALTNYLETPFLASINLIATAKIIIFSQSQNFLNVFSSI